jgi:hypothetical protein
VLPGKHLSNVELPDEFLAAVFNFVDDSSTPETDGLEERPVLCLRTASSSS